MLAKHFKSILSVSGLFLVFGHLIPTYLDWEPSFLLEAIPTQKGSIVSFKQRPVSEHVNVSALSLLDSILKPSSKKNNGRKTPRWTLRRGKPFLLQVHAAISILNNNKCLVSDLKESGSNLIKMDYQCRGKQKSSMRLRLGQEYHEKSSKLAIIFFIDSTSIPILNALNSFEHPLNIMFDPLHRNKQIAKDIGRIPHTTRIPQGDLEFHGYNQKQHGDVIQISFSQSQIKHYLKPILKESKWVHFRQGNIARNSPQLLDSLFQVLKNDSISLINTEKEFQKHIRYQCIKHQLTCFYPNKLKTQGSTLKQLEGAMAKARKTGENIVVLDANVENFRIVNENLDRIRLQGTELVSLDAI